MKKNRVSIIILTYNSSKYIRDCLLEILKQSYINKEIIVIDNCSTDGTIAYIKSKYNEIITIGLNSNLGYSAGNNYGVKHAKGDYIVIVNPDTIPDVNWLKELVRPLEENPDIAITTSKILIYDQKELINTCANYTHFTGLDFCRGLFKNKSFFSKQEEVGSISGCSFAIRKDAFEKIGGFDSDFFLYLEDTDISWRARLAGYKIVFVPTSIIYHKYKISFEPWKEYHLEKNRYSMLLKNYRLKTLVLLLPALFVTEVITWSYAILKGIPYIKSKINAYIWVISNFKTIMNKRHHIQQIRKISDHEFIKILEWRIPFEQIITNPIICIFPKVVFNTFFYFYYKLINVMI
jgi:GT2 family glycosyltransferase